MKKRFLHFIFKSPHLQIFKFFPSVIFFFIISCSTPFGEHHPEWKKYFDDEHVTGCIEIYDLKNSKFIDYNPDRCSQRFIPASTFKICNSLIALETKTIPDTNYVIKWDGVERNISSWNQDQTLTEAFHNSCVPCYEQIARKVGMENYQQYLSLLHYGNMLTGSAVDSFWLNGDLRISCDEQIEFLKDMYTYQLALSKRTIDLVKGIMVLEKDSDYMLSGKTGWGMMEGDSAFSVTTKKNLANRKNIGWFVGYVEKGDDVFFFATNIEAPDPVPDNFTEARVDITKKILTEMKIITSPAAMQTSMAPQSSHQTPQ
ncbi:MAG: class D beta-lactamase [Chitinophagales bacterium]